MHNRKFKPGDRVQLKGEGPVMQVLKYRCKEIPFVGWVLSDHEVECVWFENGERKTGFFDQRVLNRATKPTGLFTGKQAPPTRRPWPRHF